MILHKPFRNPFYNEQDIERKVDQENAKQRISVRDDFERDYGRIIHSAAFRRLQAKTQVIAVSEGDFHRTRLTHSLEVAQIARGIGTSLNDNDKFLKDKEENIDISLVEAAALAHDLGHPPFGHQGERALNKCMRTFDLNFEGNAHTFRLLTCLEGQREIGLNLTRASLLSILKYPSVMKNVNNHAVVKKPPKCSVFDEDEAVFQWLIGEFTPEEQKYLLMCSDMEDGKHLRTINKTLECSVIELADDIAYATYDLEDSLKLNLISHNHLYEVLEQHADLASGRIKNVIVTYLAQKESGGYPVKQLFADLVSGFINDVSLEEKMPHLISNRLRFKAVMPQNTMNFLDSLKKLVEQHVILSQRVQTFEWRGGQIIDKLFDAMIHDQNLLPEDVKNRWSASSDYHNARLVCDYIAGMTDNYALKMYSRLFEASGGKLFDI
ncbi:dGTPase [Paenibacillus uliginis N3/975]|uniref:Deoxyguanosinetriphosphate triphosphohydrolase-like protein n=1 Tax=Paenibacillus uliginis N3/975 TaxID=1313296 RepID=A0A1X7HRR5_9BACL|nr:anti-phage deoxyguanosine triphosphatase [Paenibacillus uliginis]SMF91769.1 dGTPase [Paenibacillus uliginis N3/975]